MKLEDYDNFLIIEHGASWSFIMTVYDDDRYKERLEDYIDNSGLSDYAKEALTIAYTNDLPKDVSYGIFYSVLSMEGAEEPVINEMKEIFSDMSQTLDLSGKSLKCHFDIPKRLGSQSYNHIVSEGVVLNAAKGLVKFYLSPDVTQGMVNKRYDMEEDLDVKGLFTINVDYGDGEIYRVLEGQAVVRRGAN